MRDDAMRYVYVIEIAFIIGLYFDMGTTGKQTSLNWVPHEKGNNKHTHAHSNIHTHTHMQTQGRSDLRV